MPHPPDVLVVTAMPREAKALRALGAVACGTRAAAGCTLDALLRARPPAAVVITGVCGGLDPSLRPGDAILASALLASGRPDLAPGAALLDAARSALRSGAVRFVTSPVLTVDAPLTPRPARTGAWNAYGAVAVDMETYDLAAAASARGAPWLALRVVLDPTHHELPPSLRAWSGETDRQVALRALGRPLEWPAYLRLALQWRIAAASLRRAAPIVTRAASAAAPGGEPRQAATAP